MYLDIIVRNKNLLEKIEKYDAYPDIVKLWTVQSFLNDYVNSLDPSSVKIEYAIDKIYNGPIGAKENGVLNGFNNPKAYITSFYEKTLDDESIEYHVTIEAPSSTYGNIFLDAIGEQYYTHDLIIKQKDSEELSDQLIDEKIDNDYYEDYYYDNNYYDNNYYDNHFDNHYQNDE